MRNLSSLTNRNLSYTSVYYAAGYGAESLRAAISFGSRKKPLPTYGTLSLKKNIRSAFVRACYAAKSGFFAIKYRLKDHSAVRALSLFYQCSSYVSTGLSTTFNAAIHLARFSCRWKKYSTTLKARPFLDFKSKSLFMMMLRMFVGCKNFKITNPIVRLYPVFMMNDFIWFKFSSKVSRHDKSVFEHLRPATVKKLGFSNIYKDIPIVISSSPLPIMMKFSSWYRHLLTPLLRESYSI